MKHKLFSVLILSFIFTSGFAQSTATILINGVKKGEYTINTDQKNTTIVVKKTDCKKMKQLLVQVQGEFIDNSIYKRTIDITSNTDESILHVPEVKPGQFTITDAKIKALLVKGTAIKLYLLMEPANERMMIPSKHIYMGTLSAK